MHLCCRLHGSVVSPVLLCRFAVSVSGGPGSSAGLGVSRRGVYMRQPHEAAAPANYTVTITPTLHEVGPAQPQLRELGLRFFALLCTRAALRQSQPAASSMQVGFC